MTGETLQFRVGQEVTSVHFIERAETVAGLGDQVLWVCDYHTGPLFPELAGDARVVTLEPGEERKSWESVDRIVRFAIDAGLGRDATFVALGGGVLCDMTAFAASIFMRGCRLVLVPTTLLAMVDASLGGKTGIDYAGYKNMVGTFHPAQEIRISTELLRTLPNREFVSGLAEVIKQALLERSPLLATLREQYEAILGREPALLARVVSQSLGVKGRLVEADFRENGVRAHLNLGHTFGHALEAVTGFAEWTHGEAIAWGIDKALRTGRLLSQTDPAYEKEVRMLLARYGFKLNTTPELVEPLLQAMRFDKKKRSGRVRFVLQRGWGDTFQTEVADEVIRAALVESAP